MSRSTLPFDDARRSAEALLEALVSSSSEAMLTTDTEGLVTSWNPGAERLFGYSASEIVGRPFTLMVPPEDLDRSWEKFRGIREGRPVQSETVRLHKDGRRLRVDLGAWPVFDEDGAVQGHAVVVRDIGERIEREEALREADARFRSAFEDAPIGIALFTIDEPTRRVEVEEVNQQLSRLLGGDPGDALVHDASAVLAPPGRGLGSWRVQRELRRADGTVVEALLAITIFARLPHGRLRGVCQVVDVSALNQGRKRLERQAAQQAAVAELGERALEGVAPRELMLRALRALSRHLEVPVAGVVEIDEHGCLTVRAAVGLEVVEGLSMPGSRSPSALALASHEARVFGDLSAFADVELPAPIAECGARSAMCVPIGGRTQPYGVLSVYDLVARAFTAEDVSFLQSVANLLADALDRHDTLARMHYRSLHDELTGLPNRACFEERLERAVRSARRTRGELAVLFLDVDAFKLVNDGLGHAAGDTLLRDVATRLSGALPEEHFLARFGGDEFVVLAENADGEEAVRLAARLDAALAEAFTVAGGDLVLTASTGIALVEAGQGDARVLLQNADAAMYHAKAAGRGATARFDHEMRASAVRRLRTQSELRLAIERDELCLLYQPVVELATGRLRGFEALVRWQHPDRGLLSPAEFVELAEETGLIVPMGEWVVGQALEQSAAWNAISAHPVGIGVNVSPRELVTGRVAATVADAVRSSGADPSLLRVEITESALLGRDDVVLTTLQELRAMGASVLLDDFGTGFSSLSHLEQFKTDGLKVDRSFVSGRSSRAGRSPVVAAVAGMAAALDVIVVAEGVETPDQAQWLESLGIQYGQGWLFGRPEPASAWSALVTSGRL